MVRHRYFAHDSRNGRSPFDRMRATHYVPRNASWWLGENIGWGSGSLAEPAAIVRAWMHSPPHRANILSRHFRDIGIGIVRRRARRRPWARRTRPTSAGTPERRAAPRRRGSVPSRA